MKKIVSLLLSLTLMLCLSITVFAEGSTAETNGLQFRLEYIDGQYVAHIDNYAGQTVKNLKYAYGDLYSETGDDLKYYGEVTSPILDNSTYKLPMEEEVNGLQAMVFYVYSITLRDGTVIESEDIRQSVKMSLDLATVTTTVAETTQAAAAETTTASSSETTLKNLTVADDAKKIIIIVAAMIAAFIIGMLLGLYHRQNSAEIKERERSLAEAEIERQKTRFRK